MLIYYVYAYINKKTNLPYYIGKKWYTNSDSSLSKCCYEDQQPLGWILGQKIRKKPKPGLSRKKRKL